MLGGLENPKEGQRYKVREGKEKKMRSEKHPEGP